VVRFWFVSGSHPAEQTRIPLYRGPRGTRTLNLQKSGSRGFDAGIFGRFYWGVRVVDRPQISLADGISCHVSCHASCDGRTRRHRSSWRSVGLHCRPRKAPHGGTARPQSAGFATGDQADEPARGRDGIAPGVSRVRESLAITAIHSAATDRRFWGLLGLVCVVDRSGGMRVLLLVGVRGVVVSMPDAHVSHP
jgi:hypothetical protein